MKDLAIFTALNHSGTSRKNFVNLKKKLHMLFIGFKGQSIW